MGFNSAFKGLIVTHNYRIRACCAFKRDMDYKYEESKNNKTNLNFTPFRETTKSPYSYIKFLISEKKNP